MHSSSDRWPFHSRWKRGTSGRPLCSSASSSWWLPARGTGTTLAGWLAHERQHAACLCWPQHHVRLCKTCMTQLRRCARPSRPACLPRSRRSWLQSSRSPRPPAAQRRLRGGPSAVKHDNEGWQCTGEASAGAGFARGSSTGSSAPRRPPSGPALSCSTILDSTSAPRRPTPAAWHPASACWPTRRRAFPASAGRRAAGSS